MNRIELLNYLIRSRSYNSYLEIGCAGNRTFRRIRAHHKVGVDPNRGGTLRISSDRFFDINQENFDLVFVDGLHHAEQVLRDVGNALRQLNDGGCIVLHDCLPTTEGQQNRTKPSTGSWTGEVWKAVVQLRTRPDCDLAVLDSDWGLGVLFKRANSEPLTMTNCECLSWLDDETSKRELLRVVDVTGIKSFIDAETLASRPVEESKEYSGANA